MRTRNEAGRPLKKLSSGLRSHWHRASRCSISGLLISPFSILLRVGGLTPTTPFRSLRDRLSRSRFSLTALPNFLRFSAISRPFCNFLLFLFIDLSLNHDKSFSLPFG